MGAGVFVIVIGALLAFAVEDRVPGINLKVAGLILMLAGGVVARHGWAAERRQRTVTLRDESSDPDAPTHVVEETVEERHAD